MSFQPEQFLANLKSQTSKKGIRQYDAYGTYSKDVSVKVKEGKPDQVKANTKLQWLIRVWDERGVTGVTKCGSDDEESISFALDEARACAEVRPKENESAFSPVAGKKNLSKQTVNQENSAIQNMIDSLVKAEKEILASHPAIESVPYNALAEGYQSTCYLNSGGVFLVDANRSAYCYLYTKTNEAGKKPRSAGDMVVSHEIKTLPISECVRVVAEKTLSHLSYVSVATGKYPIVFSPGAFLDLFGAFSNFVNAQSVLDKQSLSTQESLQKQVASSLLNVWDFGLHPHHFGQCYFDGEGSPVERLPLLQSGKLVNFIHSASTAKQFGVSPTGHARMGAKVTVAPHYFEMSSADQSVQRPHWDSYIYVDELQALHAGVQPLQGSFSLPFDGWIFKDGKKQSIESATVAGDFLTLLQEICYVDKNVQFKASGACPEIFVSSLSITGQ